jgi:hypothetical protein
MRGTALTENGARIFKRTNGEGRIQRVEGLAPLMAEFGEWVGWVDLLPVGGSRRDWKNTLISDGMVIVRHPELSSCTEIADAVGTRLQLRAG